LKEAKYANMLSMTEINSTETRLFPFGVLNKLRDETPVRYDEARQCWDLFGYEDVHRVLKDPQTFSSVRGASANENLLFMNPPKHTQMRDLVSKAFTPKAIQELAPRIQNITDELLDQVNGDEMDIVNDFATPLPVIVIAELLGVPKEDRTLFKNWSDVLVESAEDLTDETFQKLIQKRTRTVEELTEYFKKILKTRSSRPEDDLISALLKAEIEGEKLNEREIISFCILLLAAGNETTTNLITNGIRILTEEPTHQLELFQEPGLIPSFIEEVLRFYPPIIAIGRIAAQDIEIGGRNIQAGKQIISWVGSANRDEFKFTDPDVFNIRRKPNLHLSFGFGIHFCLGAPLARLEGKIAMEAISKKYEELKLVPGRQLTPIPSSFVFGLKNYPISFKRR
jgi:cytochrome P450